jgi:hypothetical protein
MLFSNRVVSLFVMVLALCALSACSVRQHLLQQAADELSQTSMEEEDMGLAREASALYLKVSESLLRTLPTHWGLSQAVTSGLTQYAYAFLSLEADRVESRDLQQAQVLRERAARMYERAKIQGLRTLEMNIPNLRQTLASAFSTSPAALPPQAVGLSYWTAAAWGGQIALSTDAPEVVADLPAAAALAYIAWQTQPSYAEGGLASLMGTLELARPGGSRSRALQYFDQAIEISQGQTPGPWLAKAEGWAVDQQDRQAFEEGLNKAIAVSKGRRDLSSQILRERAQWLLSQVDTIF